ncbi:MAG: hypothetical protein M3Q45_04910, partial [Chloroflexota bacterium]|nr:hypothetical protein [Chloroflexota bacterium]
WGVVTRRFFEAGAMTTLLMALLFIPLVFGLHDLYEWTHTEAVAEDPLLQSKAPYLNEPFFLARAAFYFIVWIGIALVLHRWAHVQDRTDLSAADRTRANDRQRQFSGPLLALYGLTVTFAAFDWLMSLEPHWFSSIYGLMIAGGQALTALAFGLVVLGWLAERSPLVDVITERHYNDLGSFLLAATLIWMYLAFSQFLIIWSGNLPEEVVWYLARLEGAWVWIAILLVLFHFAVPFALLLSGRIKRNRRWLMQIAVMLLVADLLHLWWLVAPAFHPGDFHLHWLDLAAPVGIGGVWVAVYLWWLRRRPLLPRQAPVDADPHVQPTRLQEVAVHE